MITYPLIFCAISLATLRHMVQNRSVITGQLSLNNPCLRRYLPFDYFRRKKTNLVLISFHFSPLLFYTEEKKTRLVESSDIDIMNPSSAVNRATPVFFTSGLFYKRSFLQAVFFTSGLARYVNQTEGYKINNLPSSVLVCQLIMSLGESVFKISHLPSKFRFSATYSFLGQSLSRGHNPPTYKLILWIKCM